MRTSVLAVGALVLACGSAFADIVPIQGAQTMRGSVEVWSGSPVPLDSDSFNLSAPEPLASWAPPAQDITASSVFGMMARLQATYSSIISPSNVAFDTTAHMRSTGNTHSQLASVSYTQTFVLQFNVTSPGPYRIAARIVREDIAGYQSTAPVSLTFGENGQSPIVDLRIDHIQKVTENVREFAPTTYNLSAGAYTIQMNDSNSWGGGVDFIQNGSTSFSLEAIEPPCFCDWNLEGGLNSQDFFDFLTDFFANRGDFNRDGFTNSQDFFDFLGCFFTGC